MDIGDGFYGAAMGGSMMIVTGAELVALLILACGFFAKRRVRAYLAFVAVLFVAAAHGAMAASGVGWWRKIFLGSDPVEDRAWLALGYDHTGDPPIGWLFFNIVCHSIVSVWMICLWRASCGRSKQRARRAVLDEE